MKEIDRLKDLRLKRRGMFKINVTGGVRVWTKFKWLRGRYHWRIF
jgi:hypothetical protein